MDGIWGIETDGIETVGKLDGNQPETFPVTFENIPPAAFVGLKRHEKDVKVFCENLHNALISRELAYLHLISNCLINY